MTYGPNGIVPETARYGGVHPDLPFVVQALEESRRALRDKEDFIPHHGVFQCGDLILRGFGYLRANSAGAA